MSEAGDFIFNCQMGRGRTTTGMITACLISSTMHWDGDEASLVMHDPISEIYDSIDGPSEEEAYLNGNCRSFSSNRFKSAQSFCFIRGIQDDPPTGWSFVARKGRKAPD